MIMGKYVIVVESGSDVTPELCERYGIVRVPMHVTIGDETVEDGSIDPLEIYSRCNEFGVMPKTSGCAPADFAHVYDRIHAEQPDATILHLAYSEATTCSHQSSKIAAQGRDYVFSMDTRFVSVGQSLVVVETAKYIEAHPNATVDEIFAYTNSVMDRVLLGFVPTDLAFLKAGGRLSNVAFLGAHLLKIKPCIEVTLLAWVLARSRRNGRTSSWRLMSSVAVTAVTGRAAEPTRICLVFVGTLFSICSSSSWTPLRPIS